MNHPPTLRWGTASHPGRRTENQDHLLAAPPVFAVADGMGGHVSGSAASRSAVEWLAATLAGPSTGVDAVRSALGQADAEIRALGHRADGRGAGTTVAGIACVEHGGAPYWAVFGVGDSRVYLWDSRILTQLSTDHSVVQELLDEGTITAEQAAQHPERHVITRALGVGEFGEADFALLPIESGQRLLLCSDGLSSEVGEHELCHHLAAGEPPQQTADALVRAALAAGGSDNVSVVVVDVLADDRADDEAVPFDVDATIPRVPVLPESRS